jgi:hypothetical protein
VIEGKGEVCSLYVFEKIAPAQNGAGRFEVRLFSPQFHEKWSDQPT